MPTQCPLHISKVPQKYLKEFLELFPAQDLNNQGRKLQNGVRKSFLNVICLLNVLYILVKYHKNILTCFKVMVCTNFLQFWRQGEITHGPSQLELSFLYLRFLFALRFYGPINPMGSCRAQSVYLTTRLLGRLSPLSG